MRTAMVYNFLIEAGIMASMAIVLLLIARRFLRGTLGSRVIVFGWTLVAVRLLCPLALPNPLIGRIRSPFAMDPAIRPIAGQVKVRLHDLTRHLYYAADADSLAGAALRKLTQMQYDARLAWLLFGVWLAGMAAVALGFGVRWARRKGNWRSELVPALCCVIHWFNPLVWLAASLYRSDHMRSRSEPKRLKPASIVFAAAACVLLAGAFATAEYTPPLAREDTLPAVSQLPALPGNPSDAELAAHAQQLCALAGFEMNMEGADWTADRQAGGYTLHGERDGSHCRMTLLPDGMLCSWSRWGGGENETGVEMRAADAQSERLARYALALMDRLTPGLSSRIEAFENGRVETCASGKKRAVISGIMATQDGLKPGVYLQVQTEPEVRVLQFALEAPLVQALWEEGLEPLKTQPAQTPAGEIPQGMISGEEAVAIALEFILQNTTESPGSLRRFETIAELSETDGQPCWDVSFCTISGAGRFVDGYWLTISSDGEMTDFLGQGEGNG